MARARGTSPEKNASPWKTFLGRSSTPEDRSNGQPTIASPDAASESQWAREQQEHLALLEQHKRHQELEERRRLQEQVGRWSRKEEDEGEGRSVMIQE